MKSNISIFLLVWLIFLSACSNTRHLTDEQLLYTGREKVEIISDESSRGIHPAEMAVKTITEQKVNNAIFGRRVLPPIGLWTYNYWEVDEEKKFGKWLHKKLSAPPVLISEVNPELRAKKIENELFDMGYFQSKAWAIIDTSARNPKKARITYTLEIPPPTLYNKIELESFSESLDTLINLDNFTKQVKPGDQFDLGKLKSARNDLAKEVQEEGYFLFTPEVIELNADTTIGNYLLNLSLGREQELPPEVLSRYRIGQISVQIFRSSDPEDIRTDTLYFEDMTIYSRGSLLKPNVVRDAIYFNTGNLYSRRAHQNTNARLNSLGIFRFVRITFKPLQGDTLSKTLDVKIDLDLAENINVELEADMVVKSTGFIGPQLRTGISHGNAFKGAENMNLSLKGGFEWQWGPKEENQLGALSYNFGVGYSLTFPKILFFGKNEKFKQILNQQTSVNLDLNLMNRTDYYKMASVRTNLAYQWRQNQKIKHTFSPIYINSVNLLETTAAFDSVVDNNIYIRKSFEEQFIFGMRYDFIYDNTVTPRPRNLFFQTGISTSGNLLDMIARLGNTEKPRPYNFLSAVYSQFVKVTSDFRYYFNGYNKTLATRFYAGIGIPYLNSEVLPYVEQFFSGGAYSIRGFTARTLGPGSYVEVDNSYIDQSGDVKLEVNLEYRFVISKILNGAFFIEAGNIWLVNEDENRPGSQFHINTFVDQLAVGTGLGLRFDFNFFVLRTDVGFPIRTPYVTDDSNWLVGGNIFKDAHFYLAIGYPF